MRINQLLQDIAPTKFDLTVKGLCLHSQHIQPGDVFIALKGDKTHGMDYIDQAINKGCVAVLIDSKDLECNVPTIRIDNLTDHLPTIAKTFYTKASNVETIGVTGTNGKTSVAFFISQLLNKLGTNCGLIGTLGIANNSQQSNNTTPDIITLYRALDEYAQNDINTVVLEISSHALAQNRIEGLNITQAVFTNFSQDHLDYHQTLEQYKSEKLKLFQLGSLKNVVLNADDTSFTDFNAASGNATKFNYSLNDFEDIKTTEYGFIVQLNDYVFEVPFLGEFNLMNILSAYNTLKACGFTDEQIIPLLHQLNPPPGRMQKNAQQLIWIDYAHTPDAIEKAIATLQAHYPEHNIRVIFGCGGDRDKSKRAKMGKITSKLADTIILTNDNPRSEDPQAIIDDILSGTDDSYEVIITENRQIAIENAIITLGEEECLLIAGKGHETTQIFNHETLESNDNDMVLAAIIEAARLKKIKNKQR
ncbi:UDP-N-acetylmuramoylalanyl-D-glutamate--2,6-diaminopimelate ligase [Bathymodiolus heckerae thiotrophic gill symbiont]|uniref:UDP-N-acetylmuramoyl-L-alanyl-D-glutamate--2, 6-diaminopimelate ligase n=1 Tax=Bathymodiolus heckerae thiotrophic gill symbiont TaxID=1052212 RepID=UPI0010B8B933|nr:UDP-N-acetylmuramoyl-L-alanyl-D-glutamate--2,6-diaminopimelate ligase [Bathymodiolus heckerae thiotrophic gill symbiont]CAC9955279.1 UDP-N-acetylmuramoyl-dipeptide--2,6-diaminopimelate ligase (EC 6.3.2.13) [uncultured Gammaproteobacteria bacterium]SHN91895.1 UDP-N-acetylmuramoylalanyl-D-glutamate--2,6-diaminopimelate ligase [Bathymodiolus heckerae thiotrophic gill symbiont]